MEGLINKLLVLFLISYVGFFAGVAHAELLKVSEIVYSTLKHSDDFVLEKTIESIYRPPVDFFGFRNDSVLVKEAENESKLNCIQLKANQEKNALVMLSSCSDSVDASKTPNFYWHISMDQEGRGHYVPLYVASSSNLRTVLDIDEKHTTKFTENFNFKLAAQNPKMVGAKINDEYLKLDKACNSWKKESRKQLGEKYIYGTCELHSADCVDGPKRGHYEEDGYSLKGCELNLTVLGKLWIVDRP